MQPKETKSSNSTTVRQEQEQEQQKREHDIDGQRMSPRWQLKTQLNLKFKLLNLFLNHQ